MACGNDYWDIFTDPDIPLLERIICAAAFPVVAPVDLAVKVVAGVPGCTLQPDGAMPFPDDRISPFPDTTAWPLDTNHAETRDDYICVPESCYPGLVDTSRAQGDMALCLSSTDTATTVGLASPAQHTNATIADINSDGWPDIYLLNDGAPNQLFLNDEGRHFTEAGATYGLNIGGDSRRAVFGDIDDDSDRDLLLIGASGSRTYQNQSSLFALLPAAYGIADPEPGTTGMLIGADCLLATENGARFYQRQLGGTYVEVAAFVGLADPGHGSAIAVADFDGDGADDIYLANSTGMNRLFQNLGDGQYASVETATHTAMEGQVQSMDAEWVAHAGAALPSLSVANWDAANQFYDNHQDGTFTDIAGPLGIRAPGNSTRATWGDLLGDGRPALFLGRWDQENLLYLPNLAGEDQHVTDYHDIAYPLGMSHVEKTIGAEWVDYDNDGALDLLVVTATGALHLFHNESHWIKTCPKRGEE